MVHRPARQGAFISYARSDGETAARALHARLKADAPDIPVWLDRHEIEGGVGWWNQIERAFERVEFLLLVMTPAAAASENTRREWRTARQLGVCVYPVKGVPDDALDPRSLPAWMARRHLYDPALEWDKLVAHLRRGCVIARVPFMAPPLPAGWVARPRETEAVFAELLGANRGQPVAITAALRGAGGFGKTTLAAAVCHDSRAIEAFDDGILWVTLGQTPDLMAELVKLYAALTGERPGFVDTEDAVRELALRLENRNCLIVIDDAWHSAHVQPFLRGAPGCARLVTTRLFEVAMEARRIDVDQMSADEAGSLLVARAGAAGLGAAAVAALVDRLGAWPLPIKLAGSAIRERIALGDSPDGALRYVQRALDKRGLTAFDLDHAAGRDGAVARTVDASLDLLDPDARGRCMQLGIFGEDEAIPIGVAATLWQLDEFDSEDLARRLDNLGLVEFELHHGLLRLHDVLRHFFASRLTDAAALHAGLLDRWGAPAALADAFAWRTFAYHMRQAGRQGALRALLFDPLWLQAKLAASGIHALVADFAEPAGDSALGFVRDALSLAAPILAVDPGQFTSQMVGRLLGLDAETEVAAFRDRVAAARRGAWLRLLQPTLDAPGGMLVTTLVGHAGAVTGLAFDAPGNRLLSASADGSVRLWNAIDGRLLAMVVPRARVEMRGAALSADAALALIAAADGRLYVWAPLVGGPARRVAEQRQRGLTAVALSPTGEVAISASREKALAVYAMADETRTATLSGHTDRVNAVAISDDGRRAASGADDHCVAVWNVAAGLLDHLLPGHTGPVCAVAIAADGTVVLSGSVDRTLRVWDARSGSALRTLRGHTARVDAVALDGAATRALSGGADGTAVFWDLSSDAPIARLQGHSDGVVAVALARDATRAATGSADRSIKLWRLDGARAQRAPVGHGSAVLALGFGGDGRLCGSGDADGSILVHDVGDGQVRRRIDAFASPVRHLAFSPDGGSLVARSIDGATGRWSLDDGTVQWLPIDHFAPVEHSAMTGDLLACAGSDGIVYLWDLPSGTRRARYRLVAANRLQRQSQAAGEDRDAIAGVAGVARVEVLHLSRDGRWLTLFARQSATIDGDALCGLHRIDTRTGALARSAWPAIGATREIVDTDAHRWLSARHDHALQLWDWSTGRVEVLSGHTDKINAVALCSDRRHALSCSRDRSLRVWELDTGKTLASFTADAALRALAQSAAGVIAVGDMAGRVHLLRLEPAAA